MSFLIVVLGSDLELCSFRATSRNTQDALDALEIILAQ